MTGFKWRTKVAIKHETRSHILNWKLETAIEWSPAIDKRKRLKHLNDIWDVSFKTEGGNLNLVRRKSETQGWKYCLCSYHQIKGRADLRSEGHV